jgi:hypothetical protein
MINAFNEESAAQQQQNAWSKKIHSDSKQTFFFKKS